MSPPNSSVSPEDLLNGIKLLALAVLALGFVQISLYGWWYEIPFPVSLSNLITSLTILGLFGFAIGVATFGITCLQTIISEMTPGQAWQDFIQRKKPVAIALLVALIVLVVFPPTTALALRALGIGGGMQVILYLPDVKNDNLPGELVDRCSENGCVTKAIHVVIDSGDFLYVRPDWSAKDSYYTIKKDLVSVMKKLEPPKWPKLNK